jgi:hypothetical protein
MNCPLQVITLARSEGPSKQCRKDLTVPPKLYPGLLPFLIVPVSVTLQARNNLLRVLSGAEEEGGQRADVGQ